MKVLDLNTHEEVSDSQIGQELELVIEFKTKNSKCIKVKMTNFKHEFQVLMIYGQAIW